MTGGGDLRGRTLRAHGFHSPERGRVEELSGALVAVDAAGTISAVLPPGHPGHARHLGAARAAGTLAEQPPGTILLPGFVDLHIHAPQYPQAGRALDVPLEVWLGRHTFPLEARYRDLGFAARVYARLVADLLAGGTTTAVYFATLHPEATMLLADICLEQGQRALIGKVAMDDPALCPEDYRDASAEAAVAGTAAVIDHIRHHPGNAAGLVRPLVTPRFIPACTDAALEGLGRLARDTGTAVQTHCSESDWEDGFVRARHGCSDTESLDRFGLLTPGGVLAHGNFITDSDMALIRDRQAAIAHCPLSNGFFAGAVFPLRAALDRGLRVGLGSDLSGGPQGFLPEAARMAITAARLLESGTDPALPPHLRSSRAGARIGFREAFWLATRGGGEALGLPVGCFTPGMAFDAVLIDPEAKGGTLRLWDDSGEAVLEKVIRTASRANIATVWVAGQERGQA